MPYKDKKKAHAASRDWDRRHPEKRAEYKRRYWDRSSPEARYAVYLRQQYKLNPDEYFDMLDRQGGVCAICSRAETAKGRSGRLTPLHVDHDHATKRIRGLLCHGCNVGIGYLGDSPTRLIRAAWYLS